MRPHTRTQCQDSSRCEQCNSDGSEGPVAFAVPASVVRRSNSTGAPAAAPKALVLPPPLPVNENQVPVSVSSSGSSTDSGGSSGAMAGGCGSVVGVASFAGGSSVSGAGSQQLQQTQQQQQPRARSVILVELPAELLVKILSNLPFSEICRDRLVSRRFNEICASMVNGAFLKLQSHMLQRFHEIKGKMPRRESARRNHPLARESDLVETLHMRLTLLQMTFGKHIDRKHICFFPGEILDEVQRILSYIKSTPALGRAYKVTDELYDLSTMAMEYFKDHIEPRLPEITYFGTEFLDFTTPYSSPSKRRSTSGATSVDSPCSSRASVAGSAYSEPWSGLNSANSGAGGGGALIDDDGDSCGGTNMVLRKRISKITRGMKKYNEQMSEVKRELKSCKTKMETQTKQVQEYSQRLEDYDKKFEESSRKFQNMLTELNKCKTELQFWRTKAHVVLTGAAVSGSSSGAAAAACQTCGGGGGGIAPEGGFPESGLPENDAVSAAESTSSVASVSSSDTLSAELKALANQGVFLDLGGPSVAHSLDNAEEPDQVSIVGSPRPVTRGSASGPPSPPSSGTVSRKRSAAAAASSISSSAAGKSMRGVTAKNATTRSAAKRPKVAHNN